MATNVSPTAGPAQSFAASEPAAALGARVIRRVFAPPYANPPVSNYRKLWTSNTAAFWAAFRVLPGEGGAVNQLGSNPHPLAVIQTGFQEVGFGYTFKAAASTDHWFDVAYQAGPLTARGARNSIELRLLGSNVAPVVHQLAGPCSGTLTLEAPLRAGTQYTLLFYSKVSITIACGEPAKYGEVIARFPSLVASWVRPWEIEPVEPLLAQAAGPGSPGGDTDLELARQALQAEAEAGETLLQPMSLAEVDQAGAAGCSGVSLAQ